MDKRKKPEAKDITAWLKKTLAKGPVWRLEIKGKAEAAGFDWNEVDNCRKASKGVIREFYGSLDILADEAVGPFEFVWGLEKDVSLYERPQTIQRDRAEAEDTIGERSKALWKIAGKVVAGKLSLDRAVKAIITRFPAASTDVREVVKHARELIEERCKLIQACIDLPKTDEAKIETAEKIAAQLATDRRMRRNLSLLYLEQQEQLVQESIRRGGRKPADFRNPVKKLISKALKKQPDLKNKDLLRQSKEQGWPVVPGANFIRFASEVRASLQKLRAQRQIIRR